MTAGISTRDKDLEAKDDDCGPGSEKFSQRALVIHIPTADAMSPFIHVSFSSR